MIIGRGMRLALFLSALAVVAAGAPTVASATSGPSRPRVSHLHARPLSSSSIDLDWHSPAAHDLVGTIVRARIGEHAPTSPTQGMGVGRTSGHAHALDVRRLQPGTRYTFGVFATYAHGVHSSATVVRARTGPARVGLLRAFVDGSDIVLRWRTTPSPGLARTIVRIARGATPPATPSSGRPGGVVRPDVSTVRLTDLRRGQRYAVSVWTRDTGGRLSTPAHTGFTTAAAIAVDHISGSITDTAGDPLSGAVVYALSFYSFAVAATETTDRHGHYRLDVGEGNYAVFVFGGTARGGNSDATGYQPDNAYISTRRRSTQHDATLKPGAVVTGRITDDAGSPLQGLQVYLRYAAPYVSVANTGFDEVFVDDQSGIVATTDASGRYELRGAPYGSAQVCADPRNDTVSGGVSGAGYDAACNQANLVTRPGTSVTAPDLPLASAAGGAVSGTLYDAAGHAVTQGYAELTDAAGRHTVEQVSTGADGFYLMTGIRPGRYVVCGAEYSEFASDSTATGSVRTCRPVTVVAGRTTAAPVSMHEGAALSGRITDASGRPLAGVFVGATIGLDGGGGVTDSTGRYVVRGLARGSYKVCFEPFEVADRAQPGGVLSGCYDSGRPVSVVIGRMRTGIDAALQTGGAISGHLTDSAGNPVTDAELLARSRGSSGFGSVQVAHDGAYVLSGLSDGSYQVCAQEFSLGVSPQVACRHEQVQVVRGHVVRGVDITFAAGGTVTTTVRDAAGHPVAGSDVVLLQPCHGEGECEPFPAFDPAREVSVAGSAVTDGRGQLSFRDVLPGQYAACTMNYYAATATTTPEDGFADECASTGFTLTVSAGHTVRVAQTVHDGGMVTGTVTDSDGHPVRGAIVHVTGSYQDDSARPDDFFDQPLPPDVTAADGTVSVRGVRPGQATICVDAKGAAGGSSAAGYLNRCLPEPVTVTAGGTSSFGSVPLHAAGAIAGTVRDAHGDRVRDAEVVVRSTDRRWYDETQPDAAGGYRFAQLEAGHYQVCFLPYQSRKFQAQCYDDVVWPHAGSGPIPANATKIAVSAGAVSDGIDARLAAP